MFRLLDVADYVLIDDTMLTMLSDVIFKYINDGIAKGWPILAALLGIGVLVHVVKMFVPRG